MPSRKGKFLIFCIGTVVGILLVRYISHAPETDFDGKWCYEENDITITPKADSDSIAFDVKGSALWSSPRGAHTGELNFVARPAGNTLVHFGKDCSAVLILSGGKLHALDNQGCGGMNARFNGIYERCE